MTLIRDKIFTLQLSVIARRISSVTSVVGALAAVCIVAPQANAALLVGSADSNTITIFDEQTGKFLGDFTTPGNGGLRNPDQMSFDADGNLYVSSGGNAELNILDSSYPQDSAVLRYSPTGNFLGVAASGNGLARPYGNAFGPDGNLYVSSFRTNQILRYSGKTGAFLGVFASDNNNGLGSKNSLNGPNGLLFGTDGSLYVSTEGTANDVSGNLVFNFDSQVLRYSPSQVLGTEPTTTPSVFIGQPTPLPDSQGFVSLLGLVRAANNDILVSDFAGGIRRYNLAGELVDTLSTNYTGNSLSTIGALTFGTGDKSNNLYTVGTDPTRENIGSILAYSGAKGSSTTFTGNVFTSSRLISPIGIVAVPLRVPELSSVWGLATISTLSLAFLRKRSPKC